MWFEDFDKLIVLYSQTIVILLKLTKAPLLGLLKKKVATVLLLL